MKEFDPHGIISRDSEDISEVAAKGVATIFFLAVNPDLSEFPCIITDDDAMGQMGAEHLINRGFTHFAFCGFYNIPWSVARSRAFSKRIAHAGLQTYIYKISKSQSKLSWAKERLFLADWLKELPKPLGLMACNDDRAEQVAEACKIAGLHIPEQVAILGVDNDDLVCNLTNPQLSSIAVDWEGTGYEAAELLDKMMAGEKIINQKIIARPTHVVTRQSTNILAIEDPEVAKAVRFIREHTRQNIQVNDVVAATSLSRRVLEKRFRKILGRSLQNEIRRLRVDQVVHMLVETNLPIAGIASDLGYPGVDHIARYFRREKAMSPLAYRRLFGKK